MIPSSRLRWARRIGVVGLVGLGIVLAVRAWVVPGVLASTLRAKFHGPARLDSWWLGRGSAGVEGLSLREGPGPDSPVWLSARRVETDLTLAGMLRGRFAPGRIVLEAPKLALRFDRKGDLLTKGPFAGGGGSAADLPDVEIRDAEVTIEQEGRPPLIVRGVSGGLDRSADGEDLALASDDPTLGRWTIQGRFGAGFATGTVRLASPPGFVTTPEINATIPFVPPEVWENVGPSGPLDVAVTLDLAASKVRVRTELTFREARARLGGLGIVSDATTGRLTVEDGLVRLDGLSGRSLAGTVGATGSLDFRSTPRFDLDLALAGIDVAAAPASWQLGEVGATGRLTGKAHLAITLSPKGPDLSGSSGEAVIEGAVLQGIPIKSLQLAMHAEGDDLQFETKSEPKTAARPPRHGGLVASALVLLQTPNPAAQAPAPAEAPRIRLPKSISTRIELEDVDLANLIKRLEGLARIRIPVPVAGHLALKAEAKIPLGALTDLSGYTIKGNATLKGASINGVDVGRVSSRFELDRGVLTLADLEGQLVDRPGGDASSPPPSTPPLPAAVPLIPDSFRGQLRAELSPPGRLTAHFDAEELPIGELLAPYLPRPTPLSGRLTAHFDAGAEVARLGEAAAWAVKGRVDSRQITYQGTTLDAIATTFVVEHGRATLPDLAARLGGQPLRGKVDLGLDGARAFSGEVDVTGWALDRVLALVPTAPRPSPAAGRVDGRVSVRGTLQPMVVESDGKMVVRDARVGSVPLGDLSANWVTEGDEVRVKEVQARPFGGQFAGEAAIPIAGNRASKVRATFAAIDTGRLAEAVSGGSFRLAGLASGHLSATVPPGLKGLTADASLEAPELTVQGVRTGKVVATARDAGDVVHYEVTADGPDGKVRFQGDLPLAGKPEAHVANAELRAAGFTLADLWGLLGIKGAPADLHGRASINANLRARPTLPLDLGVHGYVEVRELRWGHAVPLGNLRGILSRSADLWRVDSIRGDLVGGSVQGTAWGETPAKGPHPVNFEFEADRVALPLLLAPAPHLARKIDGYGTLRLAGRMEDTLRATADVSVLHARMGGIPLAELRLPAEIIYHPDDATGMLRSRRWSARVAGGRVQGTAWHRLGHDKSFSADTSLIDIDVETIARIESAAAKPGSGKVNGRITVHGPDPARTKLYRGKIDLDLNDGSIGEIPVIRELGRFLGAGGGGAFEDGDLHGTIAGGQVIVDELTLVGRVLQIHATGSVGFDGQLDLAVLVNTNQIIPQTGQALISIIPGLRDVGGRSQDATSRVSSFLSNRLLKFRIGGTIKSPNVALDPAVVVGGAATGFFSGILKLPLGMVR